MVNPAVSFLAFVVSLLALVISAITAWLTLLRQGKIRMTQPTVIYFGPDGGLPDGPGKVYLRSLLYSTGKRGHIVENMYVRLRRGETRQNFNVWSYGDEALNRGSGLFIPETGIAANHHFLLPPDGTAFRFSSGVYTLQVFATEVGAFSAQCLFEAELEIPAFVFPDFDKPGHGLYFDWGPDAGQYFPHVRPPPAAKLPAFFREMFTEQRVHDQSAG